MHSILHHKSLSTCAGALYEHQVQHWCDLLNLWAWTMNAFNTMEYGACYWLMLFYPLMISLNALLIYSFLSPFFITYLTFSVYLSLLLKNPIFYCLKGVKYINNSWKYMQCFSKSVTKYHDCSSDRLMYNPNPLKYCHQFSSESQVNRYE